MPGDTRGRLRVGVLVLRVWWESPDRAGLRVHVRAVSDVQQGDEEVTAVTSIPEAVDVVRTWLEQQAVGSSECP
jgi:hypothetical protein